MLPCVWQQRIQAGDFASHLYNAWLATEVKEGRAPGLAVGWQWTNVLFDLWLEGLLRAFGVEAAQRIAACLRVLIFFLGRARISLGNCRPPSLVARPLGLGDQLRGVFHIGLCDFYLSLGLSLWALALMARPGGVHRSLVVGVSALAVLAHALPVAWAVWFALHNAVARRLADKVQLGWLVASAAALWGLRQVALARFAAIAMPSLPLSLPGADQLWVYGERFGPITLAAYGLSIVLLVLAFIERGFKEALRDEHLSAYLLTVLAVKLVPFGVWLPGYRQALTLLPQRMSIFAAIALCAFLAPYRARAPERVALVAVAASFFWLLHSHHRALNEMEDRVEKALAGVPPGGRAISALCESRSRIDALEHMIDRASIGRCYSYGNYEPFSWKFRLRAWERNRIVVFDQDAAHRMRAGEYVVQHWEAPIFELYACTDAGEICVRRLQAGDRTSRTCFEVSSIVRPFDASRSETDRRSNLDVGVTRVAMVRSRPALPLPQPSPGGQRKAIRRGSGRGGGGCSRGRAGGSGRI